MDRIIELDKRLFLLINGFHAPWLDQPMFLVTGNLIWLPAYALLAYYLFKTYGAKAFLVILGVALTIALANTITSEIMKPYFARFRPTWDVQLDGLVHTVNDYRGGKFGFASSHAANTFGTAVFLFLLIEKKWIAYCFVWAVLVSYSRIYLGVHFPGDIIVGWFIGAASAWISFVLYNAAVALLERNRTPPEDE